MVNTIFDLINLLIIIRVLLSWLRPNLYAPGIRLIYKLTEPLLAPFRNLLPMGTPGLDFSPIIALIFFQLLRRLLLSFLF
ncbi:MAG TPA: YggT family protein [Firmicutes bacterium]|nr:YggT family protein [Bacillota bacterium]